MAKQIHFDWNNDTHDQHTHAKKSDPLEFLSAGDGTTVTFRDNKTPLAGGIKQLQIGTAGPQPAQVDPNAPAGHYAWVAERDNHTTAGRNLAQGQIDIDP